MAEEKKKSRNLKRENGEVCQIYAQIPTALNDKIAECATKKGMPRAGWMTSILTQVVENGGEVNQVSDKNFDTLNDKLDTIINLIAKKL